MVAVMVLVVLVVAVAEVAVLAELTMAVSAEVTMILIVCIWFYKNMITFVCLVFLWGWARAWDLFVFVIVLV